MRKKDYFKKVDNDLRSMISFSHHCFLFYINETHHCGFVLKEDGKMIVKKYFVYILSISIFLVNFGLLASQSEEEFQVNTITVGHQRFPASAMDKKGNFVITWSSLGQDSKKVSWGVFAKKFMTSFQ
ncbi:MAG: hypothetical protein ACFFCW_08865 [Candidatus Hodarchaeota archaeon]